MIACHCRSRILKKINRACIWQEFDLTHQEFMKDVSSVPALYGVSEYVLGISWQVGDKVLQRRFRIAQKLNVGSGYELHWQALGAGW